MSEVVEPGDIGNAERLVEWHGARLRHCPGLGWFVWDGHRWERDGGGRVMELAKATVKRLRKEARSNPVKPDDDGAGVRRRQKRIQEAVSAGYAARLNAMIRLAESDPKVAIKPDDFDADPWLLNVKNGILDLRTGGIRPHCHEDLLTKLAPVAYKPDAECPTWDRFFKEVTGGDDDLVRYLQQAIGYSLTGSTKEQVLFILHGSGANGKSTLLETMRYLLGDYALNTPAETLLRKRDDTIRNNVARLHGARFVTAAESDEGRYLDHSLVKQMTGGDTVTARYLYKEPFEFRPAFKLFLATNNRPLVKPGDGAMWRRIRLIPFTESFAGARQNKGLPDELRAEAEGILRWAVDGCLAWQCDGLGESDAVTRAGTGYRADMAQRDDLLGRFLASCCVQEPGASVASAALYRAYVSWCRATGVRAVSQNELGQQLKERFKAAKVKKARGWAGLHLRDTPA
jgi:putative DNA primase/helicase